MYNKNVWLGSGAIIILFILVVFLPQLTNIGQNFRSRLDGWINPPAAATIAITPNKTFKVSTLTETTVASATPLPSNTPTNTHTPTDTSTQTLAPTSSPSEVPSSTPTYTEGVQPFIVLTKTEAP